MISKHEFRINWWQIEVLNVVSCKRRNPWLIILIPFSIDARQQILAFMSRNITSNDSLHCATADQFHLCLASTTCFLWSAGVNQKSAAKLVDTILPRPHPYFNKYPKYHGEWYFCCSIFSSFNVYTNTCLLFSGSLLSDTHDFAGLVFVNKTQVCSHKTAIC